MTGLNYTVRTLNQFEELPCPICHTEYKLGEKVADGKCAVHCEVVSKVSLHFDCLFKVGLDHIECDLCR